MKSSCYAIQEIKDGMIILDKSECPILKLMPNQWESNFFHKKMGKLSVENSNLFKMDSSIIKEMLNTIMQLALGNGYDVVEVQCDIAGLNRVHLFEDAGFRLVDTKITFMTLMKKKELETCEPHSGTLSMANRDDLNGVMRLTRQGFIQNPIFYSRFKSHAYYTPQNTEDYYYAWITNHIDDPDTLFTVLKIDNDVVGYFIYKLAGEYIGKKLYKGILTVVDRDFQGKKLHLVLQSYLYRHIPEEEFYLDNTTQLTNYAVIKNHIHSGKKLNRIVLIFYWKNNELNS